MTSAVPVLVSSHAGTPCLSLWERWLSAAKTERGNRGAKPSQSPAVTALPEGEPRGCTSLYTRNGAYRYRYAPLTVLRPPIKTLRLFPCNGKSNERPILPFVQNLYFQRIPFPTEKSETGFYTVNQQIYLGGKQYALYQFFGGRTADGGAHRGN